MRIRNFEGFIIFWFCAEKTESASSLIRILLFGSNGFLRKMKYSVYHLDGIVSSYVSKVIKGSPRDCLIPF